MARTKSKPLGSLKRGRASEKSKQPIKPMTSAAARKYVLGRIGKPSKKSTKVQKKFFKDFLTRLEKRDKELEKSDLEAESEDAMNHVFDEKEGEMKLEWEVEEVLDAATIDGKLYYMVLWKGHLIEECTWETEANLANARDAIDEFYLAFPKKTGGPGVIRRGRKRAEESNN